MVHGARAILASILLLSVLMFGFAGRPPWVIVPLSLLFIVSFALGRWWSWRATFQAGQILTALREQWATPFLQIAAVAGVYYLGRAAAGLVVFDDDVIAFDQTDQVVLWALAALSLMGGAGIAIAEAGPELGALAPEDEAEQILPAQGRPSRETLSPLSPTAKPATTAEIDALEHRLAVTLPPGLRSFYLRQNGGEIGPGGLPVGDPQGKAGFAGGITLFPLSGLRSFTSSIEDYADPILQPAQFPAGAEHMILLAQHRSERLLLDYRQGPVPRPGYVDLATAGDLRRAEWECQARWWPDFETFLADVTKETQT